MGRGGERPPPGAAKIRHASIAHPFVARSADPPCHGRRTVGAPDLEGSGTPAASRRLPPGSAEGKRCPRVASHRAISRRPEYISAHRANRDLGHVCHRSGAISARRSARSGGIACRLYLALPRVERVGMTTEPGRWPRSGSRPRQDHPLDHRHRAASRCLTSSPSPSRPDRRTERWADQHINPAPHHSQDQLPE